jgi:hypothetical protein
MMVNNENPKYEVMVLGKDFGYRLYCSSIDILRDDPEIKGKNMKQMFAGAAILFVGVILGAAIEKSAKEKKDENQ